MSDFLLVDRAVEQRELRALLDRGTPQMALLYGRRRVGKTFLLTHLWQADQAFYFTASNTTPEQNRRQLLAELSTWAGEEYRAEDYANWRTVFRLLLELKSPHPLVVILDEFQYFDDGTSGLAAVASELNAVWEQRRPARPLLLVLSGSSIGLLDALASGGAPLYGRFAWIHQLTPFNYWHAAQMMPFRSLRDRAVGYGIFGGTPRYLAALRDGQGKRASLASRAAQLMLSPRGEVRMLIETAIVQEEGLRETQIYAAILRAVGDGSTELNDIASHAGVANTSALREKLERLISLGYVQATRNLGAARSHPYRYRLADPALMFYHTFVAPNETALTRHSPERFWRETIAPRLDGYMGHIFERMVEQAYIRLSERYRLPLVHEWGRWEGRDRDGRSLEMDIAAQLDRKRILTGGIKWNRRPLGADVFYHHLSMLDRLAGSGVAWAHRARENDAHLLFAAAGGFTSAFKQAAAADSRTVTLWTLADLYVHGERSRKR